MEISKKNSLTQLTTFDLCAFISSSHFLFRLHTTIYTVGIRNLFFFSAPAHLNFYTFSQAFGVALHENLYDENEWNMQQHKIHINKIINDWKDSFEKFFIRKKNP